MNEHHISLCRNCKFRSTCSAPDFGTGGLFCYEPNGLTNPSRFRTIKKILLCGYAAYAGYLILSAPFSRVRRRK